ncbi:MAG: transposase [Hyphomicrobium sp.]|nr:transposase [Hyphomicrobium sp.]
MKTGGMSVHLCRRRRSPVLALAVGKDLPFYDSPDDSQGVIMKRFVEGADRAQSTLLPEYLDDWIDEENPVIDAFVDALDLGDLGFDGIEPAATGKPGFHPSVLLKLYVYGYLNRVQSSRRLEREAGRNLELLWLLRRQAPDHKTIADFRKDNGPEIAPGLRTLRGAVSRARTARDGECRHRRQQVRLGEAKLRLDARQQPRQELHQGQGRAS